MSNKLEDYEPIVGGHVIERLRAVATKLSGSELEEVELRIDARPGSILIRYKRL